MFNDLMEKLDKIEPLLNIVTDEKLTAGAHFLAERIENPNSYVTFLGETSSGKSTLINGLIGKKILSVKASPTTGAITEVELCPEKEDSFYSIKSNATFEKIDLNKFIHLSEYPDNDIQRLKVKTHTDKPSLMNLRVFDTPGYGSIVEKHEEILKDFLPNSDVVIYTVSYKIGIQEEDYSFLGFLGELVREDTEVILVINFCPPDVNVKNKRVTEILQYVSSILGKTPALFCVPFIRTEQENEYPLPAANDLWDYVSEVINSPKHIAHLHEAFDEYINELYNSCDAIISTEYIKSCMSEQAVKEIIDEQKKTESRIRQAIPELIIPTFDSINKRLPELFDRAEENIISSLNDTIDASNTGRMDEMITYINSHYLPYAVKKENAEINSYLELKLDDLNRRVDDYINKEIMDLSGQISIRLNTYTESTVKNVSGKIAARLTTSGLKSVFASFGGAGGANAGIANAASHLLKKAGNVFGKTFSRETHNALKQFLAKIGATSMKAVGAAITVLVELVMVAVEYSTWKPKLKKKVREGVEKWRSTTLPEALKQIEDLKQENIKNVQQIADEMTALFSDEMDTDNKVVQEHMKLSESIGKEIGVRS